MSTTVLPQLEEIASELASQEEALTAQLKAVQEKLSGIRAVLPMFDEAAAAPTETLPAATEESADSSPEDDADDAPELAELPEKKTKATVKKKATKAKKSKKKDGRTANWQKYTRPGVKNQSIPDAVKLVLATQPDKGFKIAEVMEALFKDMPKAQYLKARNRVSNVLSGGVRAGDWHRGERSTYRMNAAG